MDKYSREKRNDRKGREKKGCCSGGVLEEFALTVERKWKPASLLDPLQRFYLPFRRCRAATASLSNFSRQRIRQICYEKCRLQCDQRASFNRFDSIWSERRRVRAFPADRLRPRIFLEPVGDPARSTTPFCPVCLSESRWKLRNGACLSSLRRFEVTRWAKGIQRLQKLIRQQ